MCARKTYETQYAARGRFVGRLLLLFLFPFVSSYSRPNLVSGDPFRGRGGGKLTQQAPFFESTLLAHGSTPPPSATRLYRSSVFKSDNNNNNTGVLLLLMLKPQTMHGRYCFLFFRTAFMTLRKRISRLPQKPRLHVARANIHVAYPVFFF